MKVEVDCRFTLTAIAKNPLELVKTIKTVLNKVGNLDSLEAECADESGMECYDLTEI